MADELNQSGINWILNWPAAILLLGAAVLALLYFSDRFQRVIGRLMGNMKSLSFGGVGLALNSETAPEISANFDEVITSLKKRATAHYKQQAKIHDLDYLLQQFMGDALPHKLGRTKDDVHLNARATIHVPDILFKEALYQIVDYFPGRYGSGRWFSIRMGIIGRAWRLRTSIGVGNAQHTGEELITLWGMTDEEASDTSRQKPSYLCILLRSRNSNIPYGLIFVDSESQNYFGDSEEAQKVATTLESHALVKNISEEVFQVMRAMKERAIEIAVPL